MDWNIGRLGKKWLGAEGLEKLETLPVQVELIRGNLCLSDSDRRTLLAALLENTGIDEAIQLGSLSDWQQAVTARTEAEHQLRASDTDEVKAPRRHWNCRVIEFPSADDEEETWYAIHEVHYENGRPVGYTAGPAAAGWTNLDGPDAGLTRLEQFKEALRKPVLKESDFSNS